MKITNNVITHGMSGRCGDMVFYNRKGKTYIRKLQCNYDKAPTAKQSMNRELFRLAQQFAQAVIADPIKKAAYEARSRKKRNAYNMAIAEYLRGHREGEH